MSTSCVPWGIAVLDGEARSFPSDDLTE